MESIIVVNNPKNWLLNIPGIPVLSAREYLTNREIAALRRVKVFNLCRAYRYQSLGYYVSLLAMARGHTPLPSITTIQDMRSAVISRIVADDLDDLIQQNLRRLKSDHFTLSIYFGRNLARQYDDLSMGLFRLFQAPLLCVKFRKTDELWEVENVGTLNAGDIPENHRDFVIEAAKEFFTRDRIPGQRRQTNKYDLAFLRNEDEPTPPSNARALQRFAAAAKKLKLGVEFIDKNDYNRLPEFDALFIRETTNVEHHTYRFARRAVAEGLVVIDEPDSIIKCSNKVYLTELLERQGIPIPQTVVIHKDNRGAAASQMSFPCILKQPDSSFSLGVFKVDGPAEFAETADRLLEESDLLIAQEFIPTAYDWRIGVLDRQPLFACKYHMVKSHWQIAKADAGKTTYGVAEAVPLDEVPAPVLRYALRAANAVGNGLYGVDAKLYAQRVLIMEVNDNPNLDAGIEDAVLKDEFYNRIMRVFLRRIEQARGHGNHDMA